MADYQRVVEYLRDIRSMTNPPVTDELRQHAREFADLCAQVNERLRKCSGFLQQGLRSEAIHLAEESPNLLDLVAALDLPDPQVWVEFCQATDLPVAPPLQLDRATQLNEAYAVDQPLEHLLGQHRLLALQRAQVGKRLAVMRQLAAQDPAGTFWEKDIRQFERVRLRELPGEFYEALKRRDDTTVGALVEEIEGQPWYEEVPADFRASVSEAQARIERTRLEKELRRQLDGLHEAFAARSAEQAARLLARWNETIKAAGGPNISKEIVEEAAPIAAWLEQEKQSQQRERAYKSALANFTQQLDQDATDTELDASLDKLKSFDEHPVPANLVERLAALRERRADVQRSRQKTRMAMLGTAAVVVLLIAGALVVIVMRGQSAESLARRIRTTVAGRNITDIEKVIKEAEGSAYAGDPKVATARQEALNYIHGFDEMKDKVASAKKLLAELKATYSPALKDPRATAEDLLGKAQTLDDQLAAVPGDEVKDADADGTMLALKGEVSGIRSALRGRAAGMVRDQAGAMQQQLDTVSATGTMTPEQAGLLARIEAAAGQLRDIPGLDDATKSVASDLVAAVTKKRQANDEAQATARDLAALPMKTVNVDGYKAALDDFVAAHPDAAESADFKKASEQLAALKPLDAWREQLAGLGGGDALTPKSADIAVKRVETVTAFVTANPATPLLQQLNAYTDYLKAASEALGDTGPLQKGFADLLGNPVITDLYYLEDSKGARYFVLEEQPKVTVTGSLSSRSYHFEQIDPNNPVRKKQVDVEAPLKLVNTPAGAGFKATPTAHKALATTIDTQLRALDETNWDTTGFDIIEEIGTADIDPVVKVTMLQAALTAVKTSDGGMIGTVYDKTLQGLARLNLAGATPPLLSGKPLSGPVMTQLGNILAQMPKGKTVEEAYLAKREAMFSALRIESATTGMLRKDNEVLTILCRSTPGNGMSARAAGAGSMATLGRFIDGKWEMDPSAGAFPEGTLVYIAK